MNIEQAAEQGAVPRFVGPRLGQVGGIDIDFVAAIARHRHFERQTDPPRV